jgi:hypothetical protein
MSPSRAAAPPISPAKASLAAMLTMTRDLDRLSIDSLTRSYRVPRPQIEQMLAAEKTRRSKMTIFDGSADLSGGVHG